MAEYKPNPLLIEEINGEIKGLVYYRSAEGKRIVQPKGERTAPLSEKQLSHLDRFKLASIYGNLVKKDPKLAAEYWPFCTGRMRPYQAGLSDFMKPPSIAAIDLQAFAGQPGQLIQVHATDDTRVMSVEVVIRHAASNDVFEHGPAELSIVVDHWLYTTTTAIPSGTPILVEATAADRPGNVCSAKVQFFVR
jgi:hypothetical protein